MSTTSDQTNQGTAEKEAEQPANASSQMAFGEGDHSELTEADIDEETQDDLSTYGVEEDPRPNNPRLDQPDTEFGADNRTNFESTEETSQANLFPDVEDDQMTLGMESRANTNCLFD